MGEGNVDALGFFQRGEFVDPATDAPVLVLWLALLSCRALCWLAEGAGQGHLPDTASHAFVFEQPQQMIRPLLKVLMNDLGDLWVVGDLWVEGFASDGVDVCDELVFNP